MYSKHSHINWSLVFIVRYRYKTKKKKKKESVQHDCITKKVTHFKNRLVTKYNEYLVHRK